MRNWGKSQTSTTNNIEPSEWFKYFSDLFKKDTKDNESDCNEKPYRFPNLTI